MAGGYCSVTVVAMDESSKNQPILRTESEIRPFSPLEQAGQLANQIAGSHIFARYLAEHSANTIKRQAQDLALFADYLADVGVALGGDSDFQHTPAAWRGITWGIVEGFVQWQLRQGYAITSVNARLTTVRLYAQMAVKAGAVDRQEGLLIQSVKGFSRQGGANVDEKRPKTRIHTVSYEYPHPETEQPVTVTRRSTKKAQARLLTLAQAKTLKTFRSHSPQGRRDALLMRLLLDHGLRASEVAILKVSDIDLENGRIRFFRPKVKGTPNAWTTHELTADTLQAAQLYITQEYPSLLLPHGPLILATTRLLKDGTGGELLGEPLSRVRISERVAYLGRELGIENLSAHDCRHFCATSMARLGYGVDELMEWFGWTSSQTAVRYVAGAEVKKRHRG